jgi:hypothetical protein
MEIDAGIKEVISGNDEKESKEEIFTRVVRAGKRTYFFDVKATRKDDYYLTITESKKRLGKEGKIFYEKHKIFLYKEDFDKFAEGLEGAVSFIDSCKSESSERVQILTGDLYDENNIQEVEEFTNVEFEDLGKQ